MGAEISEQDSEKLRKGAFHPGGDTSIERTAQDAKKSTCCSCKLERIPLQGSRQGQWGVVCEGDLEGAEAAVCSCSRSCTGGLCHTPCPACPTITPFFLLTSPLWASCGDLGLTSTQDWGCPKKRLWPLLSGSRPSGRVSISTGVVRAISHHHLSLSCLYCSFLQVFAISHLLWGQQGSPPCLAEVESWTFPAGEISTPQHQACSGSYGSIPGDRLVVPCGKGFASGSLKQKLISECLHSTLKVWRAI